MSELFDELSKKANNLVAEERVQLAQQLLDSVAKEADSECEAAWESEIADRLARYERGEARSIPAAEVFAAARRLIQ
jgi:putative addiction module component (TIGR02574 family)